MDRFNVASQFGVELVSFKVAINSRLIFVADFRKYRPLSVRLMWHNSVHSGVAYVERGLISCDHSSPHCHTFLCTQM